MYGEKLIRTPIHTRMSQKNKRWICLAVSACAIMLSLLLFGKSKALRNFILPGNADVTEAALNTLVNDLRQGQPLGNAITTFCQEIFDNATFPQ